MMWFFGFLVGGAVALYIGYRLPARKIKRVQFGYDDLSTKEYGDYCRNSLDLEHTYHSN